MRELHCNLIMDAVRQLWVEANTVMPPDIRSALERAMATEESPLGRELLERTLAAPGPRESPSLRIRAWRWFIWSWGRRSGWWEATWGMR